MLVILFHLYHTLTWRTPALRNAMLALQQAEHASSAAITEGGGVEAEHSADQEPVKLQLLDLGVYLHPRVHAAQVRCARLLPRLQINSFEERCA
jgi:hypothetical protein